MTGYPPRDLLLKSGFIEGNLAALESLAQSVEGTGLVVGHVAANERQPGRPAVNAVSLLHQGKIVATRVKTLLPTYDVFDEDRYFEPAESNVPVEFNGCRLGLTICEDVWNDDAFWPDRRYRGNPVEELVEQGAEIIINVSASPWNLGKEAMRREMLASLAIKAQRPVVYCNAVGGNDELIFDGSSFALNKEGELKQELPSFKESVGLCDISSLKQQPSILSKYPTSQEVIFRALVLGVKDYARKCNFHSAVIGLSGGIDSALVATIAVAALGISKVHAILMPSPWSSAGSVKDATTLANRLGINHQKIPISDVMNSFNDVLSNSIWGIPTGITAENLQSRIRGTILMAIANQKKHLLLSTGNKSELAVGYCTLYGDMNGGLSVIGDLYKTSVFDLCDWIDSESSSSCRNDFSLPEKGEIISSEIRDKPPSAELRPEQLDSDSLPEYSILDQILKGLIEQHLPTEVLIKKGFDKKIVHKVANLLKSAEFKRYQAPPLLKISNQAFGSGWKKPIASR